MRKISIALFIFLFMVIGAVLSILEWRYEKAVFLDNTIKLVYEDKKIKEYGEPYVEDNEIYLPYEFIKEHLDKNVVLDKERKRIFIDVSDKALILEEPSLTKFISENNVRINVPVKNEEGKVYVPMRLLNKIFEIDVHFIDRTNTVTVDTFSSLSQIGEIVVDDIKLKKTKRNHSLFSPRLARGERIIVFKEEDSWYKVRSQDGIVGWVEQKHVKLYPEEIERERQLNVKRKPFHTDGQVINIAWEYVGEKSPDLSEETKIRALDVVVPTWFHIINGEGTVINNGDKVYVEEAHKKGYKVWGLVSNSFNPDITSTILNSGDLRKKVIGQILLYASLYDLDGMNIDFENIYYKDKAQLVIFMKELKEQTEKQNLVLSIDITVPSSSERWSKVYDRKALGNIVDYVAVMAYDEHWASSPVSGSVASIGWVERGIIKSMEKIPPEKILLGLPFYTRRWKEVKDASGKRKVESKAISMGIAKKIIEEKSAAMVWDVKSGQYYTQYEEDNALYKIWLEESRSIALKANLVKKFKLAGTAAWRRGFEEAEVWTVLEEITKKGKAYAELGYKQ